MKTKLLALLMLLSVAGCKTKQVSVAQTSDYSEQASEVQTAKQTTNETADIVVETSDRTTSDEVIEHTVTTTEYSVPDSTGVQHITKQIVEQTTKNSQQSVVSSQQSAVAAKCETDSEVQGEVTSSVNINADVEIDEKTKTRTPWWITILCCVFLTVILIAIYLFFKRLY